MGFILCFHESLANNDNNDDDRYELIKQYNQLMKQKQYLEYLAYFHGRIDGQGVSDTKQKIKELIDRVDKS